MFERECTQEQRSTVFQRAVAPDRGLGDAVVGRPHPAHLAPTGREAYVSFMIQKTFVKPEKILAGGAVGVSLLMMLLGLSVVVVLLQKVHLTLDVNQEKDFEEPQREHGARWKRPFSH